MQKPTINRSELKLQMANHAIGVDSDDNIQQMLEHNRTGKAISETLSIRLDRIRKAWAMLCDGKSKHYVLETLAREYDVDTRTIRNDITASYELYGNFDLLEISGKLAARVNFYEKIAQQAFELEKFEESIKASKQADVLLLELQKQIGKKKTNPVTKWTFKAINAPAVIDIDYDLDE
jgi:hypothetical protein